MFGCMMFFDMIARQMEGLLKYGREVSCDAKRVSSVLPFPKGTGAGTALQCEVDMHGRVYSRTRMFQNSRDVMFQPRHLFPICW